MSAIVTREGHDAHAAEVVLIDPEGGRRAPLLDGARPRRGRPLPRHRRRGHRGRLGLRDPRLQRPLRDVAPPRGDQGPGRHRHRARCSPRVRCCWRRRPRDLKGADHDTLQDAATALRDTERLDAVRLAAGSSPEVVEVLAANPVRELLTIEGPFPFFTDRNRALQLLVRVLPRSEGAYVDDGGKVVSGNFQTAAERLPAVAAMGFHIIYLPPIRPIGRINRKGRNNTLDPGPDDVGRRGRSGPPRAATTRSTPTSARSRTSTPSSPGQRARAGGRARPGPPGGARPPVGHEQPRVLHHAGRRHHRLRGEPAEEVPGHLPAQLRQRPRGLLRRDAPHRAALDEPRRARVFRVDNPHTSRRVLEWFLAEVPDRPRRVFLAEAFTRPVDAPGLGMVGFHQSQTTSPGATPGTRSRRTSTRCHARPSPIRPIFSQHARHPPSTSITAVRRRSRSAPCSQPSARRAGVRPRLRTLRTRGRATGLGGVPRLGGVPDPDP